MGEKANKVQKWFKDNIPTVAIIAMCVIYVIYGFIHIDQTGKTPFEIIADGFVSFFMGYTIKCLFNAQGISNGEKSQDFLNTKDIYGSVLEDISKFQQYLPSFCKIHNDSVIKEKQIAILTTQFLDYNKFQEGYYRKKEVYETLTKEEKKALKRLENLKVNLINPSILLSDCEITVSSGRDLSTSKKTYLRKSNTKTLIIMLISSLFFGMFSPTLIVDWSGVIWSLLQVAWFLGFGVMQYTNGYNYILNEYRSVLKGKIAELETFRNMYKEDPEQFKVKPVEEAKTEDSISDEESIDIDIDYETFKALLDKNKPDNCSTIVSNNSVTTSQVNETNVVEVKQEPRIKTFEELIKEHNQNINH